MPYGIDKNIGGDSKENEQWMETCVKKVMKQGRDKSSAIAICKGTLRKMRGDEKKSEFILSQILHMEDQEDIE